MGRSSNEKVAELRKKLKEAESERDDFKHYNENKKYAIENLSKMREALELELMMERLQHAEARNLMLFWKRTAVALKYEAKGILVEKGEPQRCSICNGWLELVDSFITTGGDRKAHAACYNKGHGQ